MTVTHEENGFDVVRLPWASRPTAITLIDRRPNGGPYGKETEIVFTSPEAGEGLGTLRMVFGWFWLEISRTSKWSTQLVNWVGAQTGS